MAANFCHSVWMELWSQMSSFLAKKVEEERCLLAHSTFAPIHQILRSFWRMFCQGLSKFL